MDEEIGCFFCYWIPGSNLFVQNSAAGLGRDDGAAARDATGEVGGRAPENSFLTTGADLSTAIAFLRGLPR